MTTKAENLKLEIKENIATGGRTVFFNGSRFGMIDEDFDGVSSYYPTKQHEMTGNHYIAIGHALNKLNNIAQ